MENRSKLAKLITQVYQNPTNVYKLLSQDWIPRNAKAHAIGVTGSTAMGKSTLIDKIIKVYRQDKKSVMIIAIDPTESKSGGAILGDTIRMRDHYSDPDVFMRSFGSRNAQGALTKSLPEIINTVARFADVVIVETSGAGQADINIKEYVDTLVVLPETRADFVNLLKEGPHHYAHLLAINVRTEEDKRFVPLATNFARSNQLPNDWEMKVFEVNAKTGEGVENLVKNGINLHWQGRTLPRFKNPLS
jgi:LAO/AO transport system kinase